jgi:acetylornithine deacetylase/succinyl-diaminopimelate desuccinylase-like protein
MRRASGFGLAPFARIVEHMTRIEAIARAEDYFDTGGFQVDLARRVAMPTESQNPERTPVLVEYIETELKPAFEAMGFVCSTMLEAGWPFLFAERVEDPARPTVLGYGHGDVIRGLDDQWDEGLTPWRMQQRGDRWYGRGVADNKGQHSVNIAALAAVLETRGRLGFNAKFLIEMGEEKISPGLRPLALRHGERFRADVLIASDGPRLSADRPTVFLGSRGAMSFDLAIDARKGGHHSGNWGGLLADPAIQLAHAIASITTASGRIRIPEWLPDGIPDNAAGCSQTARSTTARMSRRSTPTGASPA